VEQRGNGGDERLALGTWYVLWCVCCMFFFFMGAERDLSWKWYVFLETPYGAE
jgi:hypothetical protein